MSLMDIAGQGEPRPGPPGLDPPPATPRTIIRDLIWHMKLYRIDHLPWSTRLGFLGLRVAQRIAYNLGWNSGGKE